MKEWLKAGREGLTIKCLQDVQKAAVDQVLKTEQKY
jgi:hypothetical protein